MNSRIGLHSGEQRIVKGTPQEVTDMLLRATISINGAVYFSGWAQLEDAEKRRPVLVAPFTVETIELAPHD